MCCLLPQLNNFCIIGTLRTGTTILLVLHLIFSATNISSILYQQEYLEQVQRTEAFRNQAATFKIQIKQIDTYINQRYPTLDKIHLFGYDGALAMNAITLVVSIIGLYGVYKNKNSILLPYLVWEVFCVFTTIGFVLNTAISWTSIFAELIPVVIYGYFWLVVFSYYRSPKECSTPTNAA